MITGFRFDIFIIIWFISMGMVSYLETETGIFGYSREGKYSINEISSWQGIKVGEENSTIYDSNQPNSPPEDSGFQFLDMFVYGYKLANFVGSVLWHSTIGFHLYLRDTFGIPVLPWGLPLMILLNLANFLGLMELWTKVKI